MESFFKHLLMKARTVESGSFTQQNVIFQCFIARGSPYSIRIITLIQYKTLEVRFIVQVDHSVGCVHFAHPRIRFYFINHFSFFIFDAVSDVIQERIFGTPQLHLFYGNNKVGAVDAFDRFLGDLSVTVR